MPSFIKNQNSVIIPFGTFVWLICSLVAWCSSILQYDIDKVGTLCWTVSILGIVAFIFGLIIWIDQEFGY